MKKKFKLYRPKILSRHPSHNGLRRVNKKIKLLPFKAVIRFGSLTDVKDTIGNGGDRVEINSIEAIKNSSSKLKMKKCFKEFEVETAKWAKLTDFKSFKALEDGNIYASFQDENGENIDIRFPLVGKSYMGSRNRGNTLIKDEVEFMSWKRGKTHYIVEKFYNYDKEYRLHIDEEKCFYSCRKMIKKTTPDDEKWYKNNNNSVWILEESQNFDKPNNWDEIISESIKALKATTLDVGAVDVRVQKNVSNKGVKRDSPKFIVIEINSAPSFGEITEKKYIENIPRILENKKNKIN